MSHTLTIDLPEEVYEPLKKTAEQRGQSPETVVVQWLTAAVQQLVDDPLEQFIGAFDSQGADWADQHDHYLGQSLAETRRSAAPESRSDE